MNTKILKKCQNKKRKNIKNNKVKKEAKNKEIRKNQKKII